MTVSLKAVVPPMDSRSCLGIVCNGEVEISDALIERLKSFKEIIGVDGGLNYCYTMDITPQWVIGDFDSIDKKTLGKFRQENLNKLKRTKDFTDLEVAVGKAKSLSPSNPIIIYGALGGRLDHTLSNIFLLLRNPTRLFLESDRQIVFGVKEKTEVEIQKGKWESIALIPLNGIAREVTLTLGTQSHKIPVVDKSQIYRFPLDDNSTLFIQEGELIVILETEAQPLASLPMATFKTHFRLNKPLVSIFHELLHQSRNINIQLISEEEVISIRSNSATKHFDTVRGETVSLIPFYGPVKGITTQGLLWELGNTLTELNKDFVSISNITLGTSFSLSISQGELLCILNPNLIDEKMISEFSLK